MAASATLAAPPGRRAHRFSPGSARLVAAESHDCLLLSREPLTTASVSTITTWETPAIWRVCMGDLPIPPAIPHSKTSRVLGTGEADPGTFVPEAVRGRV